MAKIHQPEGYNINYTESDGDDDSYSECADRSLSEDGGSDIRLRLCQIPREQ